MVQESGERLKKEKELAKWESQVEIASAEADSEASDPGKFGRIKNAIIDNIQVQVLAASVAAALRHAERIGFLKVKNVHI